MGSFFLAELNRKLNLRAKLLVAMSGMVLFIILSVGFLVNRAVFREVEKEINKKLTQAEATFQTMKAIQISNLIQKGRMLTQIAFVKALVSSKDPESISQFAQDSLEKIQSSVILITDESGMVLSRTDSPQLGESLSAFGPVKNALKGEEGEGLLLEDDNVYLLVTLPVRAGESVLGTISMGYRVDDEYALRLKGLTGSEVSFMAGGKIIASAWEEEGRSLLEETLRQNVEVLASHSRNPSGSSNLELRLGKETFSTTLVPIRSENNRGEGIFLIQTSKDKALSFYYTIRRLILLISGIAFLVALWISYIVARQVSRPLQELTQKSMEIAEKGDLTMEAQIKTEDEVGKLGKSFNVMIGSLRALMTSVRDVASQINSKVYEISQGSTQQATGAAEQASTVTEVSTTVEELSQTAGQIAENSETLSQVAQETLQGIQEIKSRVDQMAKKILGLGEKSHSIGNITKVIDDLADRTNLLALNAAIEAARAGEAGHGFAVVAAEVGKLAERSTESTGEIRQLIAEIQTEVNSTIMGVEDTTKWTNKGLDKVQDTARVTKEIYIATQQQKSAADQVVEAMTNIDQVTTTFASTTKQTAAAAKELKEMANQLNIAISGFKLEGGN